MARRSSRSEHALAALAAAFLAGCAPRVEVVDALTGAPLEPTVHELPDGRLVVGANGYDTRIAEPGARVALVPLWQDRFMSPSERPPPRQPRDHPACCPGTRAH